ncbi:specifically androgen-regulated gene protein-like [Tiliqua scincoides]|uniref:specifically androgen-regulated gene protein-like n=1 Tax=Tiliqua scincoides TaxID=71010 RepID=UPI003463742B
MPKKDLWVGTADPGPTAIVGSAGSCDSMISADSCPSETSHGGYDYLSVEEKECLMFLEETLDSLDTEADSGVSADDGETAEPSKHPRTWPTRDIPKELDHENIGKHKKTEQKGKKNLLGSVPVVTPSSGYHSFPRNISVNNVPQTAKSSVAETSMNADDPKAPRIIPSWGPPKHKIVDMPNDQPSKSIQTNTSTLESVITPLPETFQDQRRGHLKEGQELPLKNTENGMPYHSEVKTNTDIVEGNEATAAQQQPSPEKMELAVGKEAVLQPLSPQSNKKSSGKVISTQDSYQTPALEEVPLDSNTKQGPPTAPKPRKLPPNIILKTSKSNAVSFDIDPSHKIKVLAPSNGRPRAATGDFSMERPHSLQNQQEKARREALEKLGLPLDKEKNRSDFGIKNHISSKPRETQTNSREYLNVDDIIPHKKPDQQHDQVGGKEIHPVFNNPGIKQANFKSNTLERSGVGLSSYISCGSEDKNIKNSSSLGKTSFLDKITPNFLRNSRSRPASLGMGKDFIDLKENRTHNAEQDKSDKRRSYPLQNPAKLPRPPCVSVKITPKGVPEEHRKEALKKLGLLKE